jgi:pre-mRNA-processing factor SLU7
MADLNSMEFKATTSADLVNDKNMMALGIIPRKITREERLKLMEKERAEGPVKRDAEGNEINPHVPKFIADSPWYLADDSGESAALSHQKGGVAAVDRIGLETSEWYARGQRAGPAATKYRKGACANCGAMTHSARDCLERPRKLGAKFTGRDIQADEIIRRFDQSFEGKRVSPVSCAWLILGSVEWLR